jgi:hypothetical protein
MSKEVKYLNELAARVHAANIKWWRDIVTGEPIKRNKFELIALAISETSECLEGERKDLMDDKLPHRRMAEVEMADTAIRLLDYSGGFGIRLIVVTNLEPVALNKGEAIYRLQRILTRIPDDKWPAFHISSALSYIEAYCLLFGYDLDGAIEEKLAYNATRHDHTHEARRSKGGKQW